MILRGSFGATLLLAALGSAACYPGEVSDVSELDLVATVHSPETDFGAIQTFALPDSVVHIYSEDSIPLSHDHDDDILSMVASELESRGYTRITNPVQQPDVVVLVSATASTQTTYYVDYAWWPYWGWYGWGWGGYYGPGWGTYYPYVPVAGAADYNVGTVFIDMWDARNPNLTDEKLTSLWVAALRGLLTGSSASTQLRIQTAIQRAFDQSPYLQSN